MSVKSFQVFMSRFGQCFTQLLQQLMNFSCVYHCGFESVLRC